MCRHLRAGKTPQNLIYICFSIGSYCCVCLQAIAHSHLFVLSFPTSFRFDLAELQFSSVPAAYAPTGTTAPLTNDVIMSFNDKMQPTLATGEGLKWRQLEDGLLPLAVSANGTRGVACLMAASVLTLFDIEEDDEEEEEEEEEGDESMGGENEQSPSKADTVDGDEDKENNGSMLVDRQEEGPMEESKAVEEDANDMSNSL